MVRRAVVDCRGLSETRDVGRHSGLGEVMGKCHSHPSSPDQEIELESELKKSIARLP